MTETLTIVFGAGASHDSIAGRPLQGNFPYRPPLTRQLFDERVFFVQAALARFPTAVGLINDLRNKGETVELEAELERATNEAENDSTLRRELAALRFYLRFLLWRTVEKWETEAPGLTNYHRLIRAAGRWRERSGAKLNVVTFNYDLLADHAMSQSAGLNLSQVERYIENSALRLFKPHGSVNWVRSSEVPAVGRRWSLAEMEQRMIDAAGRDDAEFGDDFKVIGSFDLMAEPKKSSRAYFPALTVPMQAKPFECPDEHIAALRECVRDTTRLLLVGWRASEQHFLKMWKLRTEPPRLTHIVSGSVERAEQVSTDLKRLGVIGEARVWGDGFSGYVMQEGLDGLIPKL